MSENKPQGRRSRFFVARPVQGALIIRFVGYWGMYCLLSVVVGIVITYFGNVITGSQMGVRESLKNQIPFLISAFVLMPILVNDLVRFSQRFTGPICHLQNEIRRFNSGEEIEPIRFRKADFWQDLPVEFNEFVQKLRPTAPPDSAQAGATSRDDDFGAPGHGEEPQEPSNGTLVVNAASSR